jgi:hypothetical protein
MKLSQAEPSFFSEGMLKIVSQDDQDGLIKVVERCIELECHNILLQVNLPSRFSGYSAFIEFRSHKFIQSQHIDQHDASGITLATAAIISGCREGPVKDMVVDGSGIIALGEDKVAKIYALGGLIFPDGYQLLIRVLRGIGENAEH